MAREPETATQLTTWTTYKVAAKQTRLGEVHAGDEREAIEKAAKEFKVIASKLIAVQRRSCASGEGTSVAITDWGGGYGGKCRGCDGAEPVVVGGLD